MSESYMCTSCNNTLPEEKFRKYSSGKENKLRREACCILCGAIKRRGRVFKKRPGRPSYNDPVKLKAQRAAQRALKRGIIKFKPCEVCGDQRVHMHHEDYNKPLEVRFLCTKHHYATHRKYWKLNLPPLNRTESHGDMRDGEYSNRVKQVLGGDRPNWSAGDGSRDSRTHRREYVAATRMSDGHIRHGAGRSGNYGRVGR